MHAQAHHHRPNKEAGGVFCDDSHPTVMTKDYMRITVVRASSEPGSIHQEGVPLGQQRGGAFTARETQQVDTSISLTGTKRDEASSERNLRVCTTTTVTPRASDTTPEAYAIFLPYSLTNPSRQARDSERFCCSDLITMARFPRTRGKAQKSRPLGIRTSNLRL